MEPSMAPKFFTTDRDCPECKQKTVKLVVCYTVGVFACPDCRIHGDKFIDETHVILHAYGVEGKDARDELERILHSLLGGLMERYEKSKARNKNDQNR